MEATRLPPGNSREQQQAEKVMIQALSERPGFVLTTQSISLPDGSRIVVDGASGSPPVLCEAWAHIGRPKGSQTKKVLTDALKLAFIASAMEPTPRLILLFSDEAAAKPFRGSGWSAQALKHFSIEIYVVDLPAADRTRVQTAQVRQYR